MDSFRRRLQVLLVNGVGGRLNPLELVPEPLRNRIRAGLVYARDRATRILIIERGDNVVICGTPQTMTLARASRTVGPEGNVLIAEPAPDNFQRLEESRRQLKFDNVQLVQCACWHSSSEVTLQLAERAGDNKVDVSGIKHDNDMIETYDESVTVPAERPDRLAEEAGFSEVNYLEIAVNGAELEVLEGCDGIFESSPSIRTYIKGHALDEETGEAINRAIADKLREVGLNAVVTRGGREEAEGDDPDWETRAGDVFGYRP
ncbi:MAG: FkbM family methyltransferase [Bradymonadaceae bacterium]